MMKSKEDKTLTDQTYLVLKLFGVSTLLVIVGYCYLLFRYCESPFSPALYCQKMEDFGPYYNENLRASLFAGFLSLGGFLLSLKTFIVVNMKKDIFDSKKYEEAWESQRKLGSIGRKYDPLRELSMILFASILASIITAVLQITVGLHQSLLSTAICIWSAAFATILLCKSLFLIRANLRTMFDHLDD